RTSYSKYEAGGPSRLAILLSDTTSNWLSLAHGLKSIGLPFCITRSVREALQHRVILLYPSVLTSINSQELEDSVRSGKTIVAINADQPRYGALFGYQSSQSSSSHYHLHFLNDLSTAAHLAGELETTIPFG